MTTFSPRTARALAKRFRLSALPRERRALDDVGQTLALSQLSWPNLADRRHHFRRYAQAAQDLVHGHVVRHQPEERRQRTRASAGARVRQLRDGLDLAAQAAPAMVRPGRDALAGTIEIDETYVGDPENDKWGREIESRAIVAIAAEENGQGIGRIRLHRIKDVSAASLIPFVQNAVAPGATNHTDGWSGYAGLKAAGYRHKVSIISSSTDPAHEAMPRVHKVSSLLKRWLLGTHQGGIQRQHLDYYLDEFTFRFNRRRSNARGLLFHRLAEQAVAIDPAPYRTIIGKPANPGHFIA
jgi:transposase-like protein